MTRTPRLGADGAIAAHEFAGAAAAQAFVTLAAFRCGDLGELRAFQQGRTGLRSDGIRLHDSGHGMIDRGIRIGCGGQHEKRLGKRQQGKQNNR